MGDVLTFRSAPGARRQIGCADPEGAKILFFLGVRYERHDDAPRNADNRRDASRTRAPSKGPKNRKRRA